MEGGSLEKRVRGAARQCAPRLQRQGAGNWWGGVVRGRGHGALAWDDIGGGVRGFGVIASGKLEGSRGELGYWARMPGLAGAGKV